MSISLVLAIVASSKEKLSFYNAMKGSQVERPAEKRTNS
jgi:hypothetical protein